ncbi:hypothetical protein ART_1299 [Arthrobacter sp. PAMC 25486]|uniref:SpaH/EbpB family LPXTG-anchored major pilin n=1 Tax=Arthrobacter sp. PAMC 25486 TaxID=1494608 RepID=UPI000535DD51|nr:SpaH/EbpB family LPXTG-anchored major pilin [Arthrobacter sp. PAMC 25486]AIY00898.1 hypothetical protein ART_1299 [Arthrobacter sp. PAMC 25486]
MSLNNPRTLRGRLGRLASTLGVVAVGAALAFGSAAPASAAQNIDPEAKGSITVHKFQEPNTPTGLVHDGTAVDTTGLTAIPGVTFSVQQVGIDLADSANWQQLEGYTVAQAQKNLTGAAKPLITDGEGVAAFTDLPVGLYLVTETNTGTNNIAFHGEPFLVTIPLALDNDWNYDVHVYPKNTVTGLIKEMDDSKAHVIGDAVTYTLKAQVPALPAATELTAFGITDSLDGRLAYASATVTVDSLALEAGDYTLGATGQEFALTFTPDGLAKLHEVQGKDVTVTLTTSVVSLGDGAIKNQAQVFINDPANSFNSNEVTTSWGALTVFKHAAEDEGKFLAGAEFELYALDSAGGRVAGPLKDVVDGDNIFTTASGDGTFTVNGLKAGDYELVETKAPLGYKLDSTPIKAVVAEGDLGAAVVVKISNTQVPAFMLPLTGSTGTAVFLGGGLVLVAGGVLLAVARKRRTSQA